MSRLKVSAPLLGMLLLSSCLCNAQVSDEAFRQPLTEVLKQIQEKYKVSIKYDEKLVKDKVVTYAGFHFRPEFEEADPNRVAITGASGGGSQTMLMAAIDSRINLSIPVAMLSSIHSGSCPCESGLGIHLCGGGTNNVEIAAMAAPNPQLVISDGKDWTNYVPENEYPFLQRIYTFYGHADMVKNTHVARTARTMVSIRDAQCINL